MFSAIEIVFFILSGVVSLALLMFGIGTDSIECITFGSILTIVYIGVSYLTLMTKQK